MENFETENIVNEEVVSPQAETENFTEEVVSPQNGTVAPDDMSSEEFAGYINNLKNGTAPKAAEEPPKTQEKTPDVYKSFNTKEELQEFLNKTVGERISKSRERENQYNEIEAMIRKVYPDKNPKDAISEIVADMERQAAEESGMGVEEYREDAKLKADAAAWRAQEEARAREAQGIQEIRDNWAREEAQLKSVVPDFDFKKAMEENEIFKNAVLNEGLPIATAYMKALKGAPAPETRERVFEIGNASGRGGSVGAVDPVNMSSRDFDAYIKRIKEG